MDMVTFLLPFRRPQRIKVCALLLRLSGAVGESVPGAEFEAHSVISLL